MDRDDPLGWRQAYCYWLAAQVHSEGHQRTTYGGLLYLMFEKEWTVWLIANDDNRIADGLALRREFFRESGAPATEDVEAAFGPCTFLEVLVALSRRLEFAVGGSPEGWAWQLIVNLSLEAATDPLNPHVTDLVLDLLDTVIWRRYSPDGSGGFFPLQHPEEDQTKVEIWTQMNAYIAETHPEE